MASMTRPVPAPSSNLAPLPHAEAHALAASLFDALAHFAGEAPLMDEVVRIFAPGAWIEELGEDDVEAVGYTPEDWVAALAARAERRRGERHGYFLEELERTISGASKEVRIRSVVEARLTRGGAVARVERLQCGMLVRRVDGRAAVVHLRVISGRET